MRYHSRPRTQFSAERVRQAVRDYITADGGGKFESFRVQNEVNKTLHGGAGIWDAPTNHQLIRALDRLALDGEIVKIMRGVRGPDGLADWRRAVYWTPEAFQAAVDKHARDLADQDMIRSRWEQVYDRLAELGITPLVTTRGQSVQLSIEQWERITAGLSAQGSLRGTAPPTPTQRLRPGIA